MFDFDMDATRTHVKGQESLSKDFVGYASELGYLTWVKTSVMVQYCRGVQLKGRMQSEMGARGKGGRGIVG